MAKVGVFMSVYRGDDTDLFRRAFMSIKQQDFGGEIRIYVGVDGPVDAALSSEIEAIERHCYKLLRFPRNRGLVFVLNDLIASREDESFYFRMDADDVSSPSRFTRQIQYMEAHPDVDILGTDMVEVNIETGERRTVHYADSPEQARSGIGRGVPVAHPTVCFRASVFTRVEKYPEVRLNEDIEMWFACLKAGLRFDNVRETLYEFTVSEKFWRRRGWEKTWSEFKAYVRGLWQLDGFTWQYIFPLMRLLFRLTPSSIKRWVYQSKLRKRSFSKQDDPA